MSEEPRNKAVIRTPDRRLRVFVSSSLQELTDERSTVSRAISALRLTPVMFEQGARPHPPQDVYRAYLAQSDLFIGLYWQRYGQAPSGADVSGLEEEFNLSARLPRLLYVKEPAPGREPRLTKLLDRIRQEASVSYSTFGSPAELGRLVRDDLATLLSERFATGRTPTRVSVDRLDELRTLPVSTTTMVGREQAIGEVAGLVTRPGARVVTLSGPGGVGKTRLAVAVGERLLSRFSGSTVFVPLAAVTDPRLVLSRIGRAVGADPAGAPLEALAERLGDERWLLILDNLEQVAAAAADLAELLCRCPGLVILTTSRTVLGLRSEREYPVLPLPVSGPADPSAMTIDELTASPAVALFVDRAQTVRPDFAVTEANAAAVAEICRRLEGLPLAIELAAARIRLLDPGALLTRLAASLDVLGTSAVDLPARQHTLRATVEWSVGLLEDAERSLLEATSVFVDGWTVEAAAEVADLEEEAALELSETLARHSLIYVDKPRARLRMLETIRTFVAEQLTARPDADQIRRRHADFYRVLAEQADPALRGSGHGEGLGRLEADAGNLAAAARWYLGHDRGPLPHLLRVLWPFWFLRDPMSEARAWIGKLLPTAGSLDPHPRAELQWTAAVTALEVGDDATALAARQQLVALLDVINDDPFLHAVSQLAIAWATPITGELDTALRAASVALEELRNQDEPLWTALAAGSLGSMETSAGRSDDALRHLQEVRELGDRFDSAWLGAWSRAQLGTVAVLQGQLDQARKLLYDALTRSLEARSTASVTLCLIAFARLALTEGHPGQAALLVGAAEGLRKRVGLRAWPMLRQGEADLIAQIRQAQDPDRFSQMTEAGSGLTLQQAAAAV